MRGLAITTVLLAAAILAAGAAAITSGGVPDNGRHPNVGALLVPRLAGGYGIVCSGTLVSSRIFVTASHCTSFVEQLGRKVYVSFEETDPELKPAALHEGIPRTNPAYTGKGYRDDVSVIELLAPVAGITPAALPTLGALNQLDLNQSTKLTVVGYGSREMTVVKGEGPVFPFDGDREYAVGSFNALTKEWLKMSQNEAHGDEGACYGDSGGPTFLGEGSYEDDVVLAVTSTGDIPCYSTNVASRTDTPSARAFLSTFGL